MNERSGVLTEHRNIGNFLDRHQLTRQAARQLVLVLERARGRVYVDHRHLPVPPHQPNTSVGRWHLALTHLKM
jgi:hypothetical protein